MELNNYKLLYIARYNNLSGVALKIQGFCSGAKRNGFEVDIVNFESLKKTKKIILETDARYVIIRSLARNNVNLLFSIIIARFQGKRFVIDVPAPFYVYLKEVNMQNRSKIRKISKQILTFLNGPWSLWPFHRIIEYAEESPFFMLGNRNRTVLVGNGIDPYRLFLRRKRYPDAGKTIRLIAVANTISGWHGFDRIVRAMVEWKRRNSHPRLFFDVVGNDNTPYAKEMQLIAQEGGVVNDIHFHGFLSSEQLRDLYDEESLAVGSLGLYRNGLNTSSVLKVREYCLAGIPFIASGVDPDFPDNLPFRFVVSNDNEIDDILNVFSIFPQKRKTFTDEEIRQYAIDHLSYDSKFREMIDGL
jgi:glycosyltransferase involved in cell wall biosynthesis